MLADHQLRLAEDEDGNLGPLSERDGAADLRVVVNLDARYRLVRRALEDRLEHARRNADAGRIIHPRAIADLRPDTGEDRHRLLVVLLEHPGPT